MWVWYLLISRGIKASNKSNKNKKNRNQKQAIKLYDPPNSLVLYTTTLIRNQRSKVQHAYYSWSDHVAVPHEIIREASKKAPLFRYTYLHLKLKIIKKIFGSKRNWNRLNSVPPHIFKCSAITNNVMWLCRRGAATTPRCHHINNKHVEFFFCLPVCMIIINDKCAMISTTFYVQFINNIIILYIYCRYTRSYTCFFFKFYLVNQINWFIGWM